MPKGGASSLTPVYAGLREDLDAFLRAYMQLKSIRFVDYKRLFEHRGMIQLFNGRNNSAEIIEFNECLLVHCLPYMEAFVCPGIPRSLKERLFGIYSLYTFFYVQQEKHVVKVRMDPDAVRNFRALTELLRKEKIYDAYMACLKLLEDKAIKHVAFIAIHDPSNFKRFYTDGKISGVSVQTNLNDPLSNVKALIESEPFNKLGFAHREYTRLKEEFGFIGYHLTDIQQSMRGIIQHHSASIENSMGVNEIISTDHSSDQLASRGMLRSSIKEQAHSADLKLARCRRHRSSNPVSMPMDTFDYVQSYDDEAKNIKDVKPIIVKPDPISEESLEPISRKRTTRKQWRKNEVFESVSSDLERLPEGMSLEGKMNINISNTTVPSSTDLIALPSLDSDSLAEKKKVLKLVKLEQTNTESIGKSGKGCRTENGTEVDNPLLVSDSLAEKKHVLKTVKLEQPGTENIRRSKRGCRTEGSIGIVDLSLVSVSLVENCSVLKTEKSEQSGTENIRKSKRGCRTENVNEKKPKIRKILKKEVEEQNVENPENQQKLHETANKNSRRKSKNTAAIPVEEMEQQLFLNDTMELDPNMEASDEKIPTTSILTPKSIIKAGKRKLKRHVSFRENTNGELVNTIHEIPGRKIPARKSAFFGGLSYDDGEELNDESNENVTPEDPQPASELQTTHFVDEPIGNGFDDSDMFKPFPEEMYAVRTSDDCSNSNQSESESESEMEIDDDI